MAIAAIDSERKWTVLMTDQPLFVTEVTMNPVSRTARVDHAQVISRVVK
jgi:hypothetical protein